MAHFGTLKKEPVITARKDVRGSALYGANDEKLGNFEDVMFDHSSGDGGYPVIDTGGCLHSKKFLPAGRLRDNSAVGIAPRWDRFQSRLRERQKQAVAYSRTCTGESAVERGSDSADTLRKAV